MKSTKARRAFGAFFALSLVAAACGSDDDSSDSGTAAESDDSTADTTAATTADAAATTAEATETTADSTADSTAPAGDGVRLGIMAECEGPFGGFNEDVVAGATLALINGAGATSNSSDTALDGFTGAEVAGIPIELVGIGCGDDTPIAPCRRSGPSWSRTEPTL